MKTRTSRRNQDRLWRILATDGSVPPKIKVVADIRYLSMTDSEIDQAYMAVSYTHLTLPTSDLV